METPIPSNGGIDRNRAASPDPRQEGLLALYGAAYQLAARIVGNSTDAEDIVQRAYLKAFPGLPERLPAEEVRPWFFRVVVNTAKDHRRTEFRRKNREIAAMMENSPAAPDLTPDAALVAALRQSLEDLEERFRVPLALCYEQGLSQKEAAAVLTMPASTVSKYIAQGLEQLRAALNKRGFSAAPALVMAGLGKTAPAVPAGLALDASALVAQSMQSAPASQANGAFASLRWLSPGKILTAAAVVLVLLLGTWFFLATPNTPPAPPNSTAAVGVVDRPITNGGNENTTPAVPADADPSQITPRGSSAAEVFATLHERGIFITVAGLPAGECLVPCELRFKASKIKPLVDAIAAHNRLQVRWADQDRRALLYTGVKTGQVEEIAKSLKSTDAAARQVAAWQAGWVADPAMVPPLLAALEDPDPATMGYARSSLIRLGPGMFVMALGEAKARTVAETWAADPKRPQDIRTFALGALQLLAPAPATQTLLVRLAGDPNDVVRSGVAGALESCTDEAAVACLTKLTADPSSYTRRYAAHSLARIQGPKALPVLAGLSKDPDREVKFFAVTARARLGDPEAHQELLGQAHDRPDFAYICNDACRWMAPAELQRYLDGLLANPDAMFRSEVFSLYTHLGPALARPFLQQAIEKEPAALRTQSIMAMGQLGDEKSLADLRDYGNRPAADDRMAAVLGWGYVGGDPARMALKNFLSDTNPKIRQAAVLSYLRVRGEEPTVALARLARDKAPQLRVEAASQIRRIDGESARMMLKDLLADTEPDVRLAAAKAIWLIEGPRRLALMEEALAIEKLAAIRAVLIEQLGGLNDPKALPILYKAANDTAPQIRWAVILSLLANPKENRAVLLDRMARETNSKIFGELANILPAMYPNDPEIKSLLLQRLKQEKESWLKTQIVNVLRQAFQQDADVAKALKDYTPPAKPIAPPPEDEF